MDFFKKLFGKGDQGETFTCDKCGEELDESKRKKEGNEGKEGASTNTCEFC